MTESNSPPSAPEACSTGSPDTRQQSNWRRSTAPPTPPSNEHGEHCAPGNPNARWRTTTHSGRLHLADTRDQAAENAVQAWAQLTNEVGIDKVALIADSSNKEIDRLNARAQHLRAQRGELGPDELPLDSVHYGLREGDHVAFIAQHRPPGQARVENGTRGEVTNIDQDGTLTLTIDGSGRKLRIAAEDAESLRLAYAQHVYRQQGATVDRSDRAHRRLANKRETAYVQATRARNGTDWYRRPRPTRRRRTRPRPHQTTRTTHEQQPSAHTISHIRTPRRRLGAKP